MSETTPIGFLTGFKNSGTNANLGDFGKKNMVNGSKEFLMSNTLIAKISFLLLVIICFFVLLRIFILLISWYFKPNPNPYLIQCRRAGNSPKTISSNPNDKNSVPILRSRNEREGLEFTWSVWIYLNGPQNANKKDECRTVLGENAGAVEENEVYYHVFSKGSINPGKGSEFSGTNIDAVPGLYIKSSQNTTGGLINELAVLVSTFEGVVNGNSKGNIEEMISIGDIPTRKWLHVTIRAKDKQLDVYVNGELTKRILLNSLPRQNYGDVHVGQRNSDGNFGFDGEISSLRYFNSALNPVEINSIVQVGPNMCSDDSNSSAPPYFSHQWYNN